MNESRNVEHEGELPLTVDEVYAIRERVLESYVLASAWQDALYDWDTQFKVRVTEKFGSTKVLQEVPLWQALAGGSIEASPTITPEQKSFAETEISKFVHQFKIEHDI